MRNQEEALHRYAQRLKILRQLDLGILSGRPLETIAQTALDQLQQLIPYQRATVIVYDFAAQEAKILAARIAGTPQKEHPPHPLETFRHLKEFKSGEMRFVKDIEALPEPSPLEQQLQAEGIRSYFSTPLLAQDKLFGALNLGWTDPGPFASEHIEIVREVANELAVAIEQAHLRQQVQRYTVELEQQVTKQTTDLLQERNFVSAVLNTVGALVVVVDRQGRIIRFNRACEHLTGYTFDEVRDKPFWDLFLLPEEVEPVKAVFKQLWAGQFPSEYENHWLTKDGSPRLIAWSNTVLLDSKDAVEYVIGTGIDITERKQTEAKLAEERNLLRTLIDNLPDYIYVKDTESRFVIGNIAVAHIMGAASPDELIGKTDFDFYPRQLADTYYADEQQILQSGQAMINQEEVVVDPQGNKRWVLTTKVPLHDHQGQTLGLVGIGRDITERKQIEDEKTKLLHKISQQREQLRALTRQLAEAEEAERKRLARELHDQVGPNLTALGLNLNIIQSQLPDSISIDQPLQARLNDSLVLLEQTTERIRNVMADLRPPVLDDYGLVAALRWYGARFANRMNLDVSVQGEEPVPRLPAPAENALFRIAQEALTNAAKHAQATQVTVTVETEDDMVFLVVVDDGIGFESTHLTELIERKGWGLLTMNERAEAVGGDCKIEARPGQGTRVTVEIPGSGLK